MISSIPVSLGKNSSEILFKLMSLITQDCGGWGGPLLLSLHTRYDIAAPSHTRNFLLVPDTGPPSTGYNFANADPYSELPFLFSHITLLQGASRLSHPSSALPLAHTTRRESFLWCFSSLLICLPSPLDSDSLEGR